MASDSAERKMYELASSFETMLDELEMPDIFQNFDEEITLLERESIPKTTQQQMTQYLMRFRSFLKSKQLSTDFEHIPKQILNNYLL